MQKGGQEVLYRLLKERDVFITSLRASELERYSLEYKDLEKLDFRLISGGCSFKMVYIRDTRFSN